ncbi:hypothetical protein [Streptomyces sp. RFCAC02]|uniref:hypothetical protein n=1 Tax=Streptomyces sp. RFCAC02 TaxID=2499143 RepID=UPI001021C2E7|nr:hypothetical protein [Streptomyces sp. RFCAC02]
MSYGQGGPGWVPGGSQQQPPDWNALAADAERRQGRRRAWIVGGAVLGAVAVGTVVALVIVGQGGDGDPEAAGADTTLPAEPSGSESERQTFGRTSLPPLPQPREFISDADKDLAPFEPDGFFSGDTMEIEDRAYTEVASDGTEGCGTDVLSADLSAALTELGCVGTVRATYTGDGVAVTVGVVQFPDEETAASARATEAGGNLLALTGGDAPAFCENGGCRTTKNQVGRYTYYTIAGNADGSPDSGDADTPAKQASLDGNDHAFNCIIRRGEEQASASASAIVEERNREQDG